MFVTNLPFHRALNDGLLISALPFGIGIGDFNKPGHYRLSEVYRLRQKHVDAYSIADALGKYPQFPNTFDGSLPSEAHGGPSRPLIGCTYYFEEAKLVGTVTGATVSESEKKAYIMVSNESGTHMLSMPMTDAMLADYKEHSDAYFGEVQPKVMTRNTPYEWFEWFMEVYSGYGLDRDELLRRMATWPDFEQFKTLTSDELLALYCEMQVWSVPGLK